MAMVIAESAQERIEFGSGAYMLVRAATSSDSYAVQNEVATLMAGLVSGNNSALQTANLFGDEFGAINALDSNQLAAISQRFALLRLAQRCVSEMGGFVYSGGEAVPLDAVGLACVLKDARIAKRVSDIINRPLYEALDEKNVSAASLSGGAAAAEVIAPTAGPSESRAPMAS